MERPDTDSWPLCAECGEEPATDVDELCDRCGDNFALSSIAPRQKEVRRQTLEEAAMIAAQQRYQRVAKTADCETLVDAYSNACLDVCDAIREALSPKDQSDGLSLDHSEN